MTDAHFHRGGFPAFAALAGAERVFLGVHPWQLAAGPFDLAPLRAALLANRTAGVGEIGLDRLKTRTVTPDQRAAFTAQLKLAAYLHRPVVLHGAKCWGEVVAACRPFAKRIPAFLFHGFSRSTGLLPEMFAMNGYVSVGAAILNDHAVNYRTMAASLPAERLLAETDEDWSDEAAHQARVSEIVGALARVRNEVPSVLAARLAENLASFLH